MWDFSTNQKSQFMRYLTIVLNENIVAQSKVADDIKSTFDTIKAPTFLSLTIIYIYIYI